MNTQQGYSVEGRNETDKIPELVMRYIESLETIVGTNRLDFLQFQSKLLNAIPLLLADKLVSYMLTIMLAKNQN